MTKKKLKIGFLFCLFLAYACKDRQVPTEAVARVHDVYLYKADLAGLVPKNASREDSMLLVNNYIENWATSQLLLDRAKVNLPMKTQEEFEVLVEDYREKLYIKAYKDILVSRNLDTIFPNYQVEAFYMTHPEMFNLNENLLKLRYVHLSDSISGFDEIKRSFLNFSEENIEKLTEQSLVFNSYSFNDSVWVSEIKVYEQIPPLGPENNDKLLEKESFLQLEDTLGVYLIYVNDVLLRGARAPLNYAKPAIEQILRHRQKLELSKKLELEIKKDAIENKKFEIYN